LISGHFAPVVILWTVVSKESRYYFNAAITSNSALFIFITGLDIRFSIPGT